MKVDTQLRFHKHTGESDVDWLTGAGFEIGYLPDNRAVNQVFGGARVNGSETALLMRGKYYILNGDHRTAYEAIAHLGWEACLAYYNANPELKSEWSELW